MGRSHCRRPGSHLWHGYGPLGMGSQRSGTRPSIADFSRVGHYYWIAELADPTKLGRAGLRPTLKLATWLGFCGGFLLAYQTSSRAWFACLPPPQVSPAHVWGLTEYFDLQFVYGAGRRTVSSRSGTSRSSRRWRAKASRCMARRTCRLTCKVWRIATVFGVR